MVTFTHPRSPVAEAYRSLRTNIQFSSLDKPLEAFLITSTGSQEGKSTTAANLAITFAQSGSQVILVDADLRRPSQHRLFGLPNAVGLTTMMLENQEDLPLQYTAIPGLRLLSSGPLPPNPADVLGFRRMDEAIARLKKEADLIIFDTPPVIAVTDAAVLSAKVDGVLVVLSAGKTKRDQARRAYDLLTKVNANIIGAVLNNAKLDRGTYSYYAEG
ncbi:MAG: CpsD/CapB family tyrosine-protein kinase [Chloroflexi bacterium]|nr:CpsD/CapB family tyrosine-protein kinase [Chloroflexota bacterium]MBU1750225.1 CpsD/CapB family tyrosine-protein kinase [Chloroflexota bacterium]MBU1879953.1 CpsD/CapB family tyrosine-protein kinase [Chloroflexota bacterium]